MQCKPSLTWPDLFRTAAYRLEIKSAVPQEFGVIHEHRNFQHIIGVNYLVG